MGKIKKLKTKLKQKTKIKKQANIFLKFDLL
jgi:hypothetical protein